MPGTSVFAPSVRVARDEHTDVSTTVLLLAPSRSAAVRVVSVAAALPGSPTVPEVSGCVAPWSALEPPSWPERSLPAAEVAEAARLAVRRGRPDVALVAGDDDAALACALAMDCAGVPIARLGAGLRCGDRCARREINRIAIDSLSARLYTDDDIADEQLRLDGVDERTIRHVGSTVPAGIVRWRDQAVAAAAWASLGLRRSAYVLVYLNRGESALDAGGLVAALLELAGREKVVLCLDAASALRSALGAELGRLASAGVVIAGPFGFVEFLSLQAGAGAVLTDSGGVQEETATLTHGTNVLLGTDLTAISCVACDAPAVAVEREPVANGDAARRVANDLLSSRWEDA
jgi:UDP-N-acetylglucosamine 2-epimerase (non-hydrolysing)